MRRSNSTRTADGALIYMPTGLRTLDDDTRRMHGTAVRSAKLEPITTQQRGHPAPFAILLALTLAAAACTAAALVRSGRHALAACQDGAAVPWSQFALAYAGFGAAFLALTLYAVARRRARGPGGTWSTSLSGRAGLVTAVCAGVVVLAGALAVFSGHQQSSMAEESSKPNVLVVCKIG